MEAITVGVKFYSKHYRRMKVRAQPPQNTYETERELSEYSDACLVSQQTARSSHKNDRRSLSLDDTCGPLSQSARQDDVTRSIEASPSLEIEPNTRDEFEVT